MHGNLKYVVPLIVQPSSPSHLITSITALPLCSVTSRPSFHPCKAPSSRSSLSHSFAPCIPSSLAVSLPLSIPLPPFHSVSLPPFLLSTPPRPLTQPSELKAGCATSLFTRDGGRCPAHQPAPFPDDVAQQDVGPILAALVAPAAGHSHARSTSAPPRASVRPSPAPRPLSHRAFL